jgi:hypothetical protein
MAKQTMYRFYSCSLLLVHEGWDPSYADLTHTNGSSQATQHQPHYPSKHVDSHALVVNAVNNMSVQELKQLQKDSKQNQHQCDVKDSQHSSTGLAASRPVPIKSNSYESKTREPLEQSKMNAASPNSQLSNASTSPSLSSSPSSPSSLLTMPQAKHNADVHYDRNLIDMRLLDFAQTGPAEQGDVGPDHGLLFGLDTLHRILTEMLKEGQLSTHSSTQQTVHPSTSASVQSQTSTSAASANSVKQTVQTVNLSTVKTSAPGLLSSSSSSVIGTNSNAPQPLVSAPQTNNSANSAPLSVARSLMGPVTVPLPTHVMVDAPSSSQFH